MKNFSFFITCQAGIESLVKRDIARHNVHNITVQDRILRAEGTEKNMYELLVWSRFANRIYLEIAHKKTMDFDELFSLVENISWEKYLPKGIAIVTEATSIKSELSHTPTIQSITKKAIVTRLTQNTGTHHLYENRNGNEAHIQVFIIENIAYILLDITGNALHKRGYRIESGEAPIKETLASAIVVLSGWRFREPFLDPFCGSGTLAIEAILLARNIAPGLTRHFAIEKFPFFRKNFFDETKKQAREKSYPSGKYKIFAQDIDKNMIQMARENARRAGVEDDIVFEVKDFFESSFTKNITIVTNPPYGVRLEIEQDSGEDFYENFIKIFENSNISGGFITSYEVKKNLSKKLWKDRKLYNGGILARFYKKIS